MEPCPGFKPRSIFEPNICRYWEDRNPHFPAHCKHPKYMVCKTRGRKYAPPAISELGGKFPDFTGDMSTEEYLRYMRNDSDDDGYPD